jgi:hypothetical protein
VQSPPKYNRCNKAKQGLGGTALFSRHDKMRHLPDMTQLLQPTRCEATDQFVHQYLTGTHPNFTVECVVFNKPLTALGRVVATTIVVGLEKHDLVSESNTMNEARSAFTLLGAKHGGLNASGKHRMTVTDTGDLLVNSLQKYCGKAFSYYGCIAQEVEDQHAYSLIWRAEVPSHSALIPPFIDVHVDQSHFDVKEDGTPNLYTARLVEAVGEPFELRIALYIVTNIDNDPKKSRTQLVGRTSFLADDESSSYAFDSISSGRHVMGNIKVGDEWKTLVFMHSTHVHRTSSQPCGNIMIFNTDFRFDTAQKATEFLERFSQGLDPEIEFEAPEGVGYPNIPKESALITKEWLTTKMVEFITPIGARQCGTSGCSNHPIFYDDVREETLMRPTCCAKRRIPCW